MNLIEKVVQKDPSLSNFSSEHHRPCDITPFSPVTVLEGLTAYSSILNIVIISLIESKPSLRRLHNSAHLFFLILNLTTQIAILCI